MDSIYKFICASININRTTACNPKTLPCRLPYFINLNPPALVAKLPPI